ncbi:uncharacterized protein LOC123539368 [Mercenaria mercenaria]|uniref:uncharacterized protein LOC123539368 n=1 Tax=Mercenaria mercenaria TaxID=6596 RepID=UPI00234E4669|nr:uncharacterized protein LOC123539368 [Mercenaria mercenaria]
MLRLIICVGLLFGVYGYHLTETGTYDATETREDLSDCLCKAGFGCSCKGSDGDFKVVVAFVENHVKVGQDTVIWGYFQVGKVNFLKRFTVKTLDGFCRTIKGSEICFNIYHIEVYGKVHGCIDVTKPKKISLGCFSLPIA